MGDFDQYAYINDYHKVHYDRVNILVPKGVRNEWKNLATKKGKSLSAFVVEAVETYIENENLNP